MRVILPLLRLSFILIFLLSLFYLYPKQIVYGEEVCVGEVTWEGGYAAPAGPNICSVDSMNKSTCTDSNYWTMTGQDCCQKRFPQLVTTCQGSITNFDQIGSSYIWNYKCCYEVTPTPTPTPAICNVSYVQNLSCPSTVTTDAAFTINFQFYGTGPTYPYEHRSLWRSDLGSYLSCNYGADWTNCAYNNDNFDTTAPSVPGTYTYTVKSYGASDFNSAHCNSSDDSKSCTIAVVTPTPTPTPTAAPTNTPTPTPTTAPTCSSYASCDPCITGYPTNCGWNGASCESGTVVCPAGYSQWYWTSCTTNVCPTPTAGPTPTPTKTPTPTPTLAPGQPTSTPTPTKTPTPTPTPVPCLVTTSPSTHTLITGGTGQVTASVTDLPAGKTISAMLFGSYDINRATVSPTSDSTSPYLTTATAVAVGTTAVWATAKLNDGNTTLCQSTGTTDTDINVVTPTPTPTAGPTATPTNTPTPTTATPAPTSTPVPGAEVTVQGRNVDVNGNPLTAKIGQTITLGNASNDSYGAWFFLPIAPGTYTVTATIPAGYSVSYSYSGKNTSPPTASYVSGNSVSVSLPNNGNWADIYFKYTPIPAGDCSVSDPGKMCAVNCNESGLQTSIIGQTVMGYWKFTLGSLQTVSIHNNPLNAGPAVFKPVFKVGTTMDGNDVESPNGEP